MSSSRHVGLRVFQGPTHTSYRSMTLHKQRVCVPVLTVLCVGWPWRCSSSRRWWWREGWRRRRWRAASCRSGQKGWTSCSPRSRTSSYPRGHKHLWKNKCIILIFYVCFFILLCPVSHHLKDIEMFSFLMWTHLSVQLSSNGRVSLEWPDRAELHFVLHRQYKC